LYYLHVNKRNLGPFPIEELRRMADRGAFTADTPVWYFRDANWQWVPAGTIPDFVELFHEAEASAVEAARAEAREIEGEVERGERPPTRIVAIGGGKGGIGKTLLSSGLGIALASMGRTVTLVDCDLGGANLHTALGVADPERTFVDFFFKKGTQLDDLILDTAIENVRLVAGASGVLGMANPKYSQKLKFVNQLKKIDSDFVFLDLGAGTSYDTLDFFLTADEGVLVACPEPLSMQNAFDFLKTCVYRAVARTYPKDEAVQTHLETMAKLAFKPSMDDFLKWIDVDSPETAAAIRHDLERSDTALVLNMVMRRQEIKDAFALIGKLNEHLGVKMKMLGHVDFDETVRVASRDFRPYLLTKPGSKASRCLLRIVSNRFLDDGAFTGIFRRRKAVKRLRKIGRDLPPEKFALTEKEIRVEGSIRR
jgi:flagellar biosynthesis protein FlhG